MTKALRNTKLLKWLFIPVVLGGGVLLLVFTGKWVRTIELDQIATKAGDSLNVYIGDLEIELDKFEALPKILSRNPLFLQLLANPDDQRQLIAVNKELERINTIADTSAIYILNTQGVTLASSNWNKKVSFIGEDLSFRPYFKQAVQGEPGRYFALGSTSKIRGYYFAAPMYSENRVIGVITVKVHLQRLEQNWAQGFEKVVVTDHDGVIFISSYAPWRFYALTPLQEETLEKLQKSLRYGNISPQSLSSTKILRDEHGLHFIALKSGILPYVQGSNLARHEKRFLIQSHEMVDAGWTVHILLDISYVDRQVRNIVLLVAFLLVIFFLSGALLHNRRRAHRKQKEIELRSHNSLQKLNEQLEQRVLNRTRELTEANVQLTREIQERIRTENELRETQEELIQAGKLAAIGQMAASITHEISQPLAAIRMFAENSCILLDENEPEQLRVNLCDINELVIKMSNITQHLKSFARKSTVTLEPVDLRLSVSNVLVLLDMEIEKTGVRLINLINEKTFVLADQVRLEQVLLNIISNALDAVVGQPEKKITITAEAVGEEIVLSVQDSGPGIPTEDLPNIFVPFFTRKKQGNGLGLGLSLTRSILNDLGGHITVTNHQKKGAVFQIFLKSCAAVLQEEI